jgi:hypothetical protein
VNPVALYDVLNCASTALIAAEGGRAREAEQAYLEACVAAADAFGGGSREADALNVILGVVRAAASEVTS